MKERKRENDKVNDENYYVRDDKQFSGWYRKKNIINL